MEYQDGGPAFPFHAPNGGPDPKSSGLSLRDYFAAKALVQCSCNAFSFKEMAEWAYQVADAMLEARK